MATLNAKDFLRTLVFGHFTHPNYQQIKFTFDNGVLGFEMKDTRIRKRIQRLLRCIKLRRRLFRYA